MASSNLVAPYGSIEKTGNLTNYLLEKSGFLVIIYTLL